MSKIAEQIAQLKKKEKQVELLNHILESTKKYDHKDFKDVKDEVVLLLEKFVSKTIEAIESGIDPINATIPTINIASQTPKAPEQPNVAVPQQLQTPTQPRDPSKPTELSPAEKLNFAMDNRHLAGKKVSVMNDKNIDINGSVVGLDAPFVLVKTDTGPTIKVPLEKVSLA